jgi:hypothetical protein
VRKFILEKKGVAQGALLALLLPALACQAKHLYLVGAKAVLGKRDALLSPALSPHS